MVPRAAIVAAALLLGAADARAQSLGSDTVPGGCRVEIIRRDTVVDTIFGYLPNPGPRDNPEEHEFWITQAGVALSMLQPMAPLGRPDPSPRNRQAAPAGAERLEDASAIVWFQVRDDGRLSGMKVERPAEWSALTIALQRAILRADSQRALRPLPGSLRGRPVDLFLAAGHGRLRNARNVHIAVFPYISTIYRGGETRPTLLSAGRLPEFPAAAIRAGIGDSLLVEFVVDTTGRAQPGSLILVRRSYREFAEAAFLAVRTARFTPARRGDCAVAARVQMPINFVLRP